MAQAARVQLRAQDVPDQRPARDGRGAAFDGGGLGGGAGGLNLRDGQDGRIQRRRLRAPKRQLLRPADVAGVSGASRR